MSEVVKSLDYHGVIGCGFPSIVRNGVVLSAANIDHSWINTPVEELLSSATQCKVFVANDADVAGLCEQKFGIAANQQGTVILCTIGTGIGSALIFDGVLVPNTEFGHLKFKDTIAEKYTSNIVRKELDLSWEDWGGRLNEFLAHLEFIFSPNLIILGGGVSKKYEAFNQYLNLNTKIVPAQHLNDAGVIGAALYAYNKSKNH